jgi:hypothetical protein
MVESKNDCLPEILRMQTMKITFSWDNSTDTLSPCCTSEVVNSDGISLLSCLLMDDGGLPYLQTVPWIYEGISKIDAVLRGEVDSYRWDREAWGVLITAGEAIIYSLLDEDYFEVISAQEIKSALESWGEFIQSEPTLGDRKVVEL